MIKWRKKPVVVEAEVYKPGMEDGVDLYCGWYGTSIGSGSCANCISEDNCGREHYKKRPYINTLEGKHYITPGDYIITGAKGERYPIKEDIFFQTYEPVGEAGSNDD